MRRLRNREPVERLHRDTRRGSAQWTRWVYLAALLGFLVWAFDAAFGHVVYVRIDGLVVAKATAIASEYTARVESVAVTRGKAVTAGQVVAQLSSREYEERIAALKLRIGENREEAASLRGQLETAKRLQPSAQERYEAAQKRLRAVEGLRAKGLLTDVQFSAASNDAYAALDDLQTLSANIVSIEQRLTEIGGVIATAEELLAAMKTRYAEGDLRAPVDGLVGEVHVSQGDIVQSGGSLIELYSDPRYVIAFLPNGTLYTLLPGDPVTVEYGAERRSARIASIESVAPPLPEEFQKSFLPTQRQQLAYVSFDRPEDAPPLFATVRITASGFPPAWVGRLFDPTPAPPQRVGTGLSPE
ncbi:MAG: HlyD family secretion protein [Alphaproteobacteria bacterium]